MNIINKILTFILVSFFLLPSSVYAESFIYSNQKNHYSFTLPAGWIETPKSTIDEAIQDVADITDGLSEDYEAGFQIENADLFQYPYILVQQYDINKPSYELITLALEDDEFSKDFDRAIDKYSEFVSNATVDKPFVDKERHIIFINIDMDVTSVGKVKGFVAMFLGKNGVTQLNFYSLESEFSENLPTFIQIVDSFKYEQGYEYEEEEAEKNKSSSIYKAATRGGIIGAFTGGLTVSIYALFVKKRKK